MGASNDVRHSWPDECAMSSAGFARVDTKVSCVLTRFHLRSRWFLIPFYLAFRRVRRDARNQSGLLKAVFLVEDLHTCYTLSLWKDDWAIVQFGNLQSHVHAANVAIGYSCGRKRRKVEIWSAQFRLWAISSYNLRWEGLDLHSVLRAPMQDSESKSSVPLNVQ